MCLYSFSTQTRTNCEQNYILVYGCLGVHVLNVRTKHCVKECSYLELFWSLFSQRVSLLLYRVSLCIQSISLYSVRMRENADQNNCEYGHFSLSENHAKMKTLLTLYDPYYPYSEWDFSGLLTGSGFHIVEIQSVIYLYLQKGLEFFN